ncbi:MAG: hypothetical protein KDD33_12945 [Bdellovibrionales bacterium]|nr:hypothetical protein [Bdellovibrionales bacterium]
MKLFFVVYFVFCAFADPWVDSVSIESEEQHIQVSKHSENSNSTFQTVLSNHNEKSHHHSPQGCNEGCPQHTCHFGHCGTLLSELKIKFNLLEKNLIYSEFTSFIPDAPVLGIKKPPKHIA